MIGGLLRKLRGAVGTALTWAAAWGTGGFLFFLAVYLSGGPPVSPEGFELTLGMVLLAGVAIGLLGALAGGLFSLVLATVHRRSTLGEVLPERMALWGALVGMAAPSLFVGFAIATGGYSPEPGLAETLITLSVLGGATGAGTVWLARSGGADGAAAQVESRERKTDEGLCPTCAMPITAGSQFCENYPRGRMRAQCGAPVERQLTS